MPQSEEESVPPPVPTKTLVRGADGKKYYVIHPNAVPVEVDTPEHPDPAVDAIITKAEKDLTSHFDALNSANVASGVKIGITQVY